MARRLPFVCTLAFLAAVVFAFAPPPPAAANPDRVLVPEVIDWTAEAAEVGLKTMGFGATRAEAPSDSRAADGTVGRQSPGGFTLGERGSIVTIYVRGWKKAPPPPPPHVDLPPVAPLPPPPPPPLPPPPTPAATGSALAVPTVIGLATEPALQALNAAGLSPIVVPTDSSAENVGKVTGQEPSAGTIVARGSNVTIMVGRASSAPSADVEAPTCVGLVEIDARHALDGAGLSATVTYVLVPPQAIGRVAAQTPSGGTRVSRGGSVALDVGVLLLLPVPLPVVAGKEAGAAVLALRDAGFVVDSVDSTGPVGPPETYGHVISQDPPGGGSAIRGSLVRLVVGRGPQYVKIPNVVGMDVTAAQADLAARGLASDVKWADGSPNGRVSSQLPVAGAGVAPGSTVQLTAWKTPPFAAVVLTSPLTATSVPRAFGMTFTWQPVSGAQDYEFEMMVLQGETWSAVTSEVVKTPSKRPASLDRGRFRWHVRARSGSGATLGAWSEWRVLSVY